MENETLNIELGELIQEPIAEYPMPWGQGIVAWGYPDDAKVVTFLCSEAYKVAYQHGEASSDKEIVGILVGNVYFCPRAEKIYTLVEAAIPAKLAVGTRTQVVFEHEAWAPVLEQKQKHFPERRIVGWYHTHPGFGVFFSSDDDFWHRLAFPNFWQVALVYDPLVRQAAFFGWNSDRIEPICGFYELLGKGQKFSRIARLGTGWDFERCQERPAPGGKEKGVPGLPPRRHTTRMAMESVVAVVPPGHRKSGRLRENEAVSRTSQTASHSFEHRGLVSEMEGERWARAYSWLRYIGFLLIAVAGIIFIIQLIEPEWLDFSKLLERLFE